MAAPRKNKNAAKTASERKPTVIAVRVPRDLKGRVVMAARPGKLSPWVVAAIKEKLARE